MKMHDNYQQKTLSATIQADSPLWQELSDCEAEPIKGGTILYSYIVRFDSPTQIGIESQESQKKWLGSNFRVSSEDL